MCGPPKNGDNRKYGVFRTTLTRESFVAPLKTNNKKCYQFDISTSVQLKKQAKECYGYKRTVQVYRSTVLLG